MQWVLVALGGAVGSVARYGLARLGARFFGDQWFPAGTFAANVVGCFLLGIVFVLGEHRSVLGVEARIVLGTGLLGGFTTYSAFNLEALNLGASVPMRGVLYVGLTLVACLAAGLAGLAVGRGLQQ